MNNAMILSMPKPHKNRMQHRRLIVILLIASILGYGTAWAFDGHSHDSSDHVHVMDQDHLDHQVDEDQCDHCCHASAHFLGFTSESNPQLPVASNAFLLTSTEAYIACATDPPIKPPQT